jgi:2-dehydropantoate 2-reductase
MIQIIGAGAIGCLWMAKLLQKGLNCHIVSRTLPTPDILHFTDQNKQQHTFNVSHSQRLLNDTKEQQQSLILVCVKATQVVSALLKQQQYINEKQTIILMHNGLGCAEHVAMKFPNNVLVCATTANGSLLNNKMDITHTGSGPSYFGLFKNNLKDNSHQPISGNTIHGVDCLLDAIPDCHWVDDIIEKCWLKLIINALINPLTAIHQIKNGQLTSYPYNGLLEPLLLEVYEIALAEQHSFELSELQKTVYKVIEATAHNYSSMNRDIFYHRQTEITFINGYLIEKARQHNIDTPILKDLYQKIITLEAHEIALAGTH